MNELSNIFCFKFNLSMKKILGIISKVKTISFEKNISEKKE